MGIGMGCLGMSLHDFERCTPFEFHSIFEAWSKRAEMSDRAEWEKTRYLCMCILQPYSKKKMRPVDVVVFPWERNTEPKEVLSKEEEEARYQAALKRYGIRPQSDDPQSIGNQEILAMP